jgi:hypothetical protein
MCKLTGKTRYRQNWLGQLIVQVSEWDTSFTARFPNMVEQWRDATALDLLAIEKGEIQVDRPSVWGITPIRPGSNPPPDHERPPPPPPPPPARVIWEGISVSHGASDMPIPRGGR